MKTAYLLVHHYASLVLEEGTISHVIGCYSTPELRARVRKGVEATMHSIEDLEDVDIEVDRV
jgi:hypothetical protein